MAYPLTTNLSSKPNATLTSLNDTLLDDNFAKSLETLINGWTQNSTYKITLSNTPDNNKFAVQFTTTIGNDSGDYKLRDYVNDKINPPMSDGQLNVDISSKKITYTQKAGTTKTDVSTTKTTTQAPNTSKASTINTLAQQIKQSGVFDNPLAKDVAYQGYDNLSEEILRVKKLMKL
jgi:hypothetical protein